jgi:hypothetical protein
MKPAKFPSLTKRSHAKKPHKIAAHNQAALKRHEQIGALPYNMEGLRIFTVDEEAVYCRSHTHKPPGKLHDHMRQSYGLHDKDSLKDLLRNKPVVTLPKELKKSVQP